MTTDSQTRTEGRRAGEATTARSPEAKTKAKSTEGVQVFVSFHEKDRLAAETIAEMLNRLGVTSRVAAEPTRQPRGAEEPSDEPIAAARTVAWVVGIHGASEMQAEQHKASLQKVAEQRPLRIIAVLLPGASEQDLPDWFHFDSTVRFAPDVHGLGAVGKLYWAITAEDRAQARGENIPELEELAEKTRVPERIRRLADFLGRDRKVREISEWVSYLRDNPIEVHRCISSTPREELADWHSAETYFALDVLRGRVNMARHFASASYPYLEHVWLDDVKQLRAYLIWKQGNGVGEERAHGCYMKACEELNGILFNPCIKAGLPEFLPITEYISNNLLHRGELDCGKPATRALIQKKAWCVWRCTGKSDEREKQNWEEAEQYVRRFYGNIVPAVEKRDPASIQRVLEALKTGHGLGYRYHVVNCFEAALLIYFLDPDSVRKCHGDKDTLI